MDKIGYIKSKIPATGNSILKQDEQREELSQDQQAMDFVLENIAVQNDVELNTNLTSLIAEMAKDSDMRTLLQPAIPHLIKLLGNDNQLSINTLRSLANLCFDNDESREAILETGKLSEIVNQIKNKEIAHIALGSVLNISMENGFYLLMLELVQSEMVQCGIVGVLQDILCDIKNNPKNCPLVIRVFSNILESDSGLEKLYQDKLLDLISSNVEYVTSLLSSHENYSYVIDYMDALSILLDTISEVEKAQTEMETSGLLLRLLDFIDTNPDFDSSETVDGETSLDSINVLLAKVVTSITMSDVNMTVLTDKPEIIKRFIRWMSDSHIEQVHALFDDIRMSGALCIDKTCLKLVKEHGVVEPLLQLAQIEINRLNIIHNKSEIKPVIKVIHAVIGAFKNLSLAVGAREILGTLGTINTATAVLQLNHMKPVLVGCIGILKNLCAGENGNGFLYVDANTYRIMTGLNPPEGTLKDMPASPPDALSPLGKVIRLIWNISDDTDGGIRTEGGRLIVNVIRAINRTKAEQFIPNIVQLNSIAPLIQILTGAVVTRNSSESPAHESHDADHHVHFDAAPEASKVFPMVQNEALVAITILCSISPPCAQRITRYSQSVTPTLEQILASTETKEEDESRIYPIETKMNVCLLLRYLAKEPSYKDTAKTSFEPLLKSVESKLGSNDVEKLFRAAIGQVLAELQ
ncbi:Rap1 GTPase-GDP dissociation stimulator 1 [Boothiomyces sp. JEL0838]|nr:Rap1 GTPase-GDP dissociation stimulator 1 [Boothiomyces sp. JEL0838]